jgi:hypothetical protein
LKAESLLNPKYFKENYILATMPDSIGKTVGKKARI